MNKASAPKPVRKTGEQVPLFAWNFGKLNLILVLAAVAVIVIGYVFLGIGPYDSVQSRTIAPVLLVIGYLVMLPIGILVQKR